MNLQIKNRNLKRIAEDYEIKLIEEENQLKSRLLGSFKRLKWCLENYYNISFKCSNVTDSSPCIVFPDGNYICMGFAAHMSGDPGKFKVLGFNGYSHFFSFSLEKRNQFLTKATQIYLDTIGNEPEKLSYSKLQENYSKYKENIKDIVKKM